MPTVLSGQQHASGRCTDRRPGVKLGHAQTFFCQGVNGGRLDNLLPVATQLQAGQVIGQRKRSLGLRSDACEEAPWTHVMMPSRMPR